MATLSEEDFQRLQNQLLELRSKNYALEEKNTRYFDELKQVHAILQTTKSELDRALKTINRSKNAREFDNIFQENERLQQKLQSQEDEFRLQNETLVQETRSLTTVVEQLKKDLEYSRLENQSEKEDLDALLRLQAENNTLKKLLHKVSSLKQGNKPPAEPSQETEQNFDLEMQTSAEERQILKEKILKLQKSHQEEVLQMQAETEKLNEKLKKKQESILQLHSEKEKIYSDCKTNMDSSLAVKDAEILKLKQELENLNMQYRQKVDLEKSEATVAFLENDKASFEYTHDERKRSLTEHQESLSNVKSLLEESRMQIELLNKQVSSLEEYKQNLETEKLELETLVDEKTQLAEKRKMFMDEMNAHILETTNKHSKEIEDLTQQLLQEQEALQKIIDKERATKLELLQSQQEVNSLKKEIEGLKIESLSIKEDCKNAEESKFSIQKKFEMQEDEYKMSINELNKNIKQHSEEFNVQLEILRAEKAEFQDEVVQLEQEIRDFHDEKKIIEKKNLSLVKDLKHQLLSERKRAEKLQERLQLVLNEQNQSMDDILRSSPSTEKPKGDISSISSWSYVSADAMDKECRENNTVHSDVSSCDQDSPSRFTPNSLENETSNLLSKVTHMQQKNWLLEEKVSHLEIGNEAMADDLMKKTAIIQFYCMDGRSNVQSSSSAQDKLTIKRIVDFIKDKGDENLREVNRKMQRMLEETLTKNMYLQKDIEKLTKKMVNLEKTEETSPDVNIESPVIVDKL